ncbi:MAG: AAA family ATPase [Candidatus Coprovivens sp.]
MGFFNETEEEKKYRNLIRVIKSAQKIDLETIQYLVDYVEKIRDKEINNDFYEYDFLEKVLLELLDTHFEDYVEFKSIFDELGEIVKFLLPEGMETEDYQNIKNMVINKLIGNNSLIKKGLFDKNLYSVFSSRYDYLFIIDLISSYDNLPCSYRDIFNFVIEVAPYIPNQTMLRCEVVSCINGLKGVVGSADDYFKQRISDARKRVGIFPVDEKTLALISAEAEKAQSLIVKLEVMQKKIDKFKDTIDSLVNSGRKDIRDLVVSSKKEIGDYSLESINKMQESVNEAKTELLKQLDEYLISLELTLKQSSDKVFNQILLDAQEKIRQIRVAAEGLTNATTSELIRIQQASADSVDRLKNYVENEPKLQELLQKASNDSSIREALLQFSSLNAGAMSGAVVGNAQTGILIPGHDRLVIPANPNVVVPEKVENIVILPAFDESIPFDVRLEKVLLEKRRREENGEIFHEMTEEIIICLMEGDWPYLWGPSGCGKSYLVKQVASLLGIELIDNGKITDKYSIMAYNDPHGNFRATQAFVALTYGKMLLLDEFDNGNPDTQVVLNELYSGLLDVLEKPDRQRFVTFAEDMTVPIHPNFRMISAGNTSGEGENAIFSSRGKMDESVQERMTPKKINYDNRVEQRIFGEYESWYELFVNFRKICDGYAKAEGLDVPPGIVTTRDASAITKYIRHNSKSVDQIMREKFVQTKSDSYLNYIIKQAKKMYGFGEVYNEVGSYSQLSEISGDELGMRLILSCEDAIKNGRR